MNTALLSERDQMNQWDRHPGTADGCQATPNVLSPVLTVSLHSTRLLLPSAFVFCISATRYYSKLLHLANLHLFMSASPWAHIRGIACKSIIPTEATPPLLHRALLAVYSKCMLRLQIQHCTHRQTCCKIAKSSLFWDAAAPCRYFCVITLLLVLYYTEISFYLLILPEVPDFSVKWTELSCLKCNQPCVIICREDTAYWSYRR